MWIKVSISLVSSVLLLGSTHLHHLLRLDVDHQQSAEEGLCHVDVLVPDVDGRGPDTVLRRHPFAFGAHLILGGEAGSREDDGRFNRLL